MSTNKSGLIKIVYMGDSITEGQYIDTALRWSNLISHELERKFFKKSFDFIALYSGVSGETSRQALLRFPNDIQMTRPDIMTLQFGLNDANVRESDNGLPRVSENSYKANLLEMIERAKNFGVSRIILSTNHKTLRNYLLPGGKSLEQRRLLYNDIVRDVAILTGVVLCDIALKFDSIPAGELSDYLLPYPDRLHLSVLGHEYYALIIKPYIDEALKFIFSDVELIKSEIQEIFI